MWPVLAALVVLTSACRLETNVTINVAEDGSGTFITELGIDEEMQGLLESFGGSEDLLAGLDLGGITPAETRTEGDMTYFAASQAFTDIAQLRALLDENQDQAAFEEFELDVNEDGALLVAKTGPLSTQDGLDVDALPIDPTSLTEDVFAANVFVTLPGKIVRHNADEVLPGDRLRWSISLTEPLNIEAESSLTEGGLPWLPIGIAAVAVLGIGGFLVTRRRDDASSVALRATDAPPAPMGFGDSSGTADGTGSATTTLEAPPRDGTVEGDPFSG
jgi:hypothetical protein